MRCRRRSRRKTRRQEISNTFRHRHQLKRPVPRPLDALYGDCVFALRSFRKTPGVIATVVLTLALAIGASTTMFSIVNGVLLNPLPVANSDRLVWSIIEATARTTPCRCPTFRDWSRDVTSFEATATWIKSQAALGDAGMPVQVAIADVTDNWFSMLGVRMQLGRAFTAGEEGVGKPKIAILSHTLWRSQFGAEASVVGRAIRLDGTQYTVVGVAQPGFDFPDAAQLWRPMAMQHSAQRCRGCRFFHGPLALMKRGVTFEQARAESRAVAARLHTLYPVEEEGLDFDIQPLHEHFVGDTRAPLLVLLGAVGCLLLIACANVATLLLARANARATEIGVRMALGAARGRVAMQLFIESTMLAVAGGALGVLLSVWATHAIVAMRLETIPTLANVSLDVRVLIVSFGVTVVAGIVFGMAPALQASQTDIVGALKAGSRAASGPRASSRLRGTLLVTEVALVVPLLIGAALLVQSFTRLLSQPVGFNAEQVVRFELVIPACGTMWAPDSTCAGVTIRDMQLPVQRIVSYELYWRTCAPCPERPTLRSGSARRSRRTRGNRTRLKSKVSRRRRRAGRTSQSKRASRRTTSRRSAFRSSADVTSTTTIGKVRRWWRSSAKARPRRTSAARIQSERC